MTEEVVVTSRGRTTIPTDLRRKYGIGEGSRLQVEDTGKGILLKKVQSILDSIGSASNEATVGEMKQLLDEMRSRDEER